MYSGNLIDNLIQTVERAEQQAQDGPQPSREDYYLVFSMELEPNLAGVA